MRAGYRLGHGEESSQIGAYRTHSVEFVYRSTRNTSTHHNQGIFLGTLVVYLYVSVSTPPPTPTLLYNLYNGSAIGSDHLPATGTSMRGLERAVSMRSFLSPVMPVASTNHVSIAF